MLSKKYRLKGQKNFAILAKRGRRIHCGDLTFIYQTISDLGPTQIGIVVSAKVNKRATIRNTIKRRLRVVFARLLAQGILPKNNLKIMVLVKPTIVNQTTEAIQGATFSCLERSRFG